MIYRPGNYGLMWISIGAGAFILLLVFLPGASEVSMQRLVPVLTFLLLIGYVDLSIYWLKPIKINDKELFVPVEGLGSRRIDIANIQTIEKDTVIFPVRQSILAIRHRETSGKISTTTFYPSLWTEHVLGRVIAELVKRNNAIELDDYAKAMRSKA